MHGIEKEILLDRPIDRDMFIADALKGSIQHNWYMIERGLPPEELLAEKMDPDIINEYCCLDPMLWSELDSIYGPEYGELVALKKARAEKIEQGQRPGLLTPRQKQFVTLIPKGAAGVRVSETASYRNASAAKRVDSASGKKLGLQDYVALYKMSLRNHFWQIDGRQGMNQIRGGTVFNAVWIFSAIISYGLPLFFIFGLISTVQWLLVLPISLLIPELGMLAVTASGGLGITVMSAFLMVVCSPIIFNSERLRYNWNFQKSAWWRNTGIHPRDIVKDKGLYGEYIGTMVTEQNLEKFKLYGRVFNSVIVEKPDGNFNELDIVCVNETGIHVIEAKARGGKLVGGLTEKKWEQYMGGQKHTMDNPLYQNNGHINCLTEYLFAHMPDGSARTRVSFPYSYVNVALQAITECDGSGLNDAIVPGQFFLGQAEGKDGYQNLDLRKMYTVRFSRKEVDQICAAIEKITGYPHEVIQQRVKERSLAHKNHKYDYTAWYSIVRLESVTADGETEINDFICKEEYAPEKYTPDSRDEREFADKECAYRYYMDPKDGMFKALPNSRIKGKSSRKFRDLEVVRQHYDRHMSGVR